LSPPAGSGAGRAASAGVPAPGVRLPRWPRRDEREARVVRSRRCARPSALGRGRNMGAARRSRPARAAGRDTGGRPNSAQATLPRRVGSCPQRSATRATNCRPRPFSASPPVSGLGAGMATDPSNTSSRSRRRARVTQTETRTASVCRMALVTSSVTASSRPSRASAPITSPQESTRATTRWRATGTIAGRAASRKNRLCSGIGVSPPALGGAGVRISRRARAGRSIRPGGCKVSKRLG
jgi:hypothetical protein